MIGMASASPRVLNFGSLNIDYVYVVDHIAREGETISGRSFEIFAGGKGANQSVALAKAGATVWHAGRIGRDGQWLKVKLDESGVDSSWVTADEDSRTGHAVIQVDRAGKNAIVLYPGTNWEIDRAQIDRALASFGDGDVLLLQNEINELPYLIEAGRERGMIVCFNPAPFEETVLDFPLDSVHVLIVNEVEGHGLSGGGRCSPDEIMSSLADRFPDADIVLTLGDRGVRGYVSGERISLDAVRTRVADTTAAGDTFIGYLWACRTRGQSWSESLATANRAAALCVGVPGAMDSIPSLSQVMAFTDNLDTR